MWLQLTRLFFFQRTAKKNSYGTPDIPMFIEPASPTESSDDVSNAPILPGAAPPTRSKILFIPSKEIVGECSERLNTTFAAMSSIWLEDCFVSMVIPWECDHQIIASKTGKAFGVAEKTKLYEAYK